MANLCNLCEKRILSHSVVLNCACCHKYCHLTCIPNVSPADSLQTIQFDDTWFCPICLDFMLPFNCINNEVDFVSAISEMWSKSVTFSLDQLNEKIFNPFDLNEYVKTSPLFDNDPDFQFYNNYNIHNTCEYYLENV